MYFFAMGIASVPLDLVKRMPELGDEPEFRDLQIVHRAMRKGLDNDCRIDFTIDTTVVLQPMEGTEAPY